jgi:hypothetical protein
VCVCECLFDCVFVCFCLFVCSSVWVSAFIFVCVYCLFVYFSLPTASANLLHPSGNGVSKLIPFCFKNSTSSGSSTPIEDDIEFASLKVSFRSYSEGSYSVSVLSEMFESIVSVNVFLPEVYVYVYLFVRLFKTSFRSHSEGSYSLLCCRKYLFCVCVCIMFVYLPDETSESEEGKSSSDKVESLDSFISLFKIRKTKNK